jgi:hypothetical protein
LADHVGMSQQCPKCHDCENFFVSWDARAPLGCNVFGFKGKQLPSLVVLQSSGQPCSYFRDKRGSQAMQAAEPVLPEGCTFSISA